RGSLASITDAALLSGANAAAIETAPDRWEVVQFAAATLAAPLTYSLSRFLRAQAGSDDAMPASVSAGARFVLLDAAVARVDLSAADVGLAISWRYGPATQPLSSPGYVTETHAFSGRGLRPLSPCHVRGQRASGDLALTWVRRTRIGGDNWEQVEVPLGEDSERYEVDILDGTTVKRTIAAVTPSASYTAAEQTADFGAPQPSLTVRVFQLSATAGRGTPRLTTL
ncbi:MAG TPA: hypothetical protein PK264_18700, partial [Hyphomicrobiaceae bacterium]|nr:hypothetical protein [Hyphomicrobiaceae bacterium]